MLSSFDFIETEMKTFNLNKNYTIFRHEQINIPKKNGGKYYAK